MYIGVIHEYMGYVLNSHPCYVFICCLSHVLTASIASMNLLMRLQLGSLLALILSGRPTSLCVVLGCPSSSQARAWCCFLCFLTFVASLFVFHDYATQDKAADDKAEDEKDASHPSKSRLLHNPSHYPSIDTSSRPEAKGD